MIFAITAVQRLLPAGVVAFVIHDVSPTTIAVGFAALVYVVSVAKDFRPIKALRSDLAESRKEAVEKDRKITSLIADRAAAVAHAETLASSRDFATALADALKGYDDRAALRDEKMLAAFEDHDKHERTAWAEITGSLSLIAQSLGSSATQEGTP